MRIGLGKEARFRRSAPLCYVFLSNRLSFAEGGVEADVDRGSFGVIAQLAPGFL
jgi:hypothetical protein